MMFPSPSTQILSASFTVESLCATSTIVVSSSLMSVSSASCTSASDCVSSADVASSRNKIFGWRSITRAMAMRWRCPPLSRTPFSPMRVWKP